MDIFSIPTQGLIPPENIKKEKMSPDTSNVEESQNMVPNADDLSLTMMSDKLKAALLSTMQSDMDLPMKVPAKKVIKPNAKYFFNQLHLALFGAGARVPCYHERVHGRSQG